MTSYHSDTAEAVSPTSYSTGYPTDDDPGARTGYEEVDEEFAPRARRKLGRLTVVLAAVLVAGIGLVGGVELQKHYGSSGTTGGAGFAATAGRGGLAGAGGAGAGGTGTGTGAGATGSTAAVPAVIGQIVSISGQTMVVKNLGGTDVTVHLSNTTTITKSFATAALAAGQTVSVAGTTGTDSSVTATSVTVR